MFASKDVFLAAPKGGYTISRSVRTRSSASAYFSRTFASDGNRLKWTWSAWLKIGVLSTYRPILACPISSGTSEEVIYLFPDGQLVLNDGTVGALAQTNAVFRDPSAWYHIMFVYDSAQGTAANRGIFYVNGVQQTNSVNSISLSRSSYINRASIHTINSLASIAGYYFDGYTAEVNFIDGQALTPSSFGATDATTGVWNPKKYSGSYGTNGYYLNFSDNSAATAATIGKDSSGNGNNWTPNNISVTAGPTYDSMVDSPTVGPTASNYAVFNPLAVTAYGATFAQGNLLVTTGSTGGNAYGSFAIPASGKWYWEITAADLGGGGGNWMIGISAYRATEVYTWQNPNCVFYYTNGQKYVDGSGSAYGASYTTNAVIGVAVDVSAGTITFYKNNVSQGSITHAVAGLFPCLSDGASATGDYFYANFGQRPFTYTPPSGFLSLNTQNLPTPTITNGAAYMAATTYTGNGGSLAVTNTVNGISFQPDFVWVKGRSYASYHGLYDSVRGTGTTKGLCSNLADAEGTNAPYLNLTSFNSNGFTVGSTSSTNFMNASASTLVGWQWKAGGSSVTNTNGSITSTVNAGVTQGFSIVTYTGNGSAGATIGHGLGVAPSLIMLKSRSAAVSWVVYLAPLGNTGSMYLNLTNSFTTVATWNNTTPTSSVFSVNGAGYYVNDSGATYVAYCFTPIVGYSAFGTYLGNGSADGSFVYCGFKPRWIMIRITDATTYSWLIFDTTRMQYNSQAYGTYADLSIAEQDLLALGYPFDILSNGFKPRVNWGYTNANGYTYFYAAFAENPFKYSRAR